MTRSEMAAFAFAVIYIASIASAWLTPGAVKRWWVMRQDGLLALMRAHYVLGEQAVFGGDSEQAEKTAETIEALDRRWRHGNSRLSRVLVGLLALVTGMIAFMMLRAAGFAGLAMFAEGKRLNDAMPNQWVLLAMALLGAVHGVAGLYSFDDWRNPDEPHGLDQRLRQMLAAGRAVRLPGAKPNTHGGRRAARELFGLGDPYTRKSLDRARRLLARQHHPDVWVNAPASKQRAHEAAMKRINAAYELLVDGAS